MKRLTAAVLATALFLNHPLYAADAPAASPDELVSQLQGKSATPIAAKTAIEWEAAYTAALPKLIEKPETDDLALQTIALRAGRPGAEIERAALGNVLARQLSAEAPAPLKVMLLRHVQRIGRGEVVTAVVALLNDSNEQVRESARRALGGNPSKEAGDALRAAIDQAKDAAWKGALVSALEYRRDPADAPVFAKLAAATEADAVRTPALLALARTGGAAAAPVLAEARNSGSEPTKKSANDAYLLLADRLTPTDKEAAASIYREFLTGPSPFRQAAIIGLGHASKASEMAQFIDLLSDKDLAARGAALSVLSRHKDPAVARAIADKVKASEPATRPWLIRALAEQGGKEHLGVFAAAASDPEVEVRIQAIRALGAAGDASALPLLLKSAQAKGDEQLAARAALENLPGAEIDKGLMPLVATGSTPERVEAIRSLGARNAKQALPAIITAASDAEALILAEALRAIGLLGDAGATDAVIGLMKSAKEDADREAAGKALAAVVRKNEDADNRLKPVIEAANAAPAESKGAFLSVLGQVGGDKALAAVREAIKSTDEKTHEAAVRALTGWSDDAPLADLLTLAREEKKENLSVLSLRGYVRLLAINRDKRKIGENLKLFAGALEACRRPDEKKQVLGGMGDIKDIKALSAIAPLLSDPALINEASAAALKVADKHADKDKALAKSTLEKVLELSKNENHKKQAQEILKRIAPAQAAKDDAKKN